MGRPWWAEVLSNDGAGARDFYGRLFGWTTIETSFEPIGVYAVFKRRERSEAGLLPICKDWNLSPPVFVHTAPKHGRIGSLVDPGGAAFVIRGPVPDPSPSRVL